MISPLNWGLGHASRIIPVINLLTEMGHKVYIGGSGKSIEYLKEYFHSDKFIYINSPNIKYGRKNAIGPGFVISFMSFVKSIYQDYIALRRISKRYNIDVVISDNRPGLFSKKIRTIYITHQVNVMTRKPRSISGRLVRFVHRKMLKRFDYCLVPDNYGEISLAGELSTIRPDEYRIFVGVLSRFQSLVQSETLVPQTKLIEILAVLSGPEPQRSMFENILLEKFNDTSNVLHIVRGVVGESDFDVDVHPGITFYNNPSDKLLFDLIKSSNTIVCRSGYSTLMDLAVCKRKALLVATPGQPEQEYLVDLFAERYQFETCCQDELFELDFKSIKENGIWNYPYEKDKLKNVLALCLD